MPRDKYGRFAPDPSDQYNKARKRLLNARKKLKDQDFLDPTQRKFPKTSKSTAKGSLARATQLRNDGIISRGTFRTIHDRYTTMLKGGTRVKCFLR